MINDLITSKVADFHKSQYKEKEPKYLYISIDLWKELVSEMADLEFSKYFNVYKNMKVIIVNENNWCEVS